MGFGVRSTTQHVDGLARLFNIEAKSDLEKYCRGLVVNQVDFVAFILVARHGGWELYRYACHFAERVPSHLRTTDEELARISQRGWVHRDPGSEKIVLPERFVSEAGEARCGQSVARICLDLYRLKGARWSPLSMAVR